MLYIRCPYCGKRDENEFLYGGQAHSKRPEPAEDVSEEEWRDYLFVFNNNKGLDFERWVHEDGCRQWFNVIRDTVTHEIKLTYPIGELPPKDIAYEVTKQSNCILQTRGENER